MIDGVSRPGLAEDHDAHGDHNGSQLAFARDAGGFVIFGLSKRSGHTAIDVVDAAFRQQKKPPIA